MRTDLSITHDDNEGTHYLNFDKLLGEMGVETGGYVGCKHDTDGNVYVTVVDKIGDILLEFAVPVDKLI